MYKYSNPFAGMKYFFSTLLDVGRKRGRGLPDGLGNVQEPLMYLECDPGWGGCREHIEQCVRLLLHLLCLEAQVQSHLTELRLMLLKIAWWASSGGPTTASPGEEDDDGTTRGGPPASSPKGECGLGVGTSSTSMAVTGASCTEPGADSATGANFSLSNMATEGWREWGNGIMGTRRHSNNATGLAARPALMP